MNKIIDNLFNKKDDEAKTIAEVIQENDVEETSAENAQVDEETNEGTNDTQVEEAREELHKINAEMIAEEIDDEKCEECNNEHCECIDRQSAILNFDLFIGELRQILNRYQGLDFELVQMKKEIYDLIKDC